jgi:hypothetical protein
VDLDELIEHYKRDADGLCYKLVKPLMKQGGKEFIDRKKLGSGRLTRKT